jgi:hypothetical protein
MRFMSNVPHWIKGERIAAGRHLNIRSLHPDATGYFVHPKKSDAGADARWKGVVKGSRHYEVF